MEFIKGLGFLLLIVATAFAPLFGLYYIIKNLVGIFDRSVYGRKVDLKYAEIVLSSKFTYYQKLDSRGKARFMRRLHRFIENKDFIGSGGINLTDEMIVMISASAIQLTFGLKEYKLNHFSKIFVYPKAFYSKISKQYHKGETNLAGAIVLSWSHFLEGYSKPNDKINLGLHEMAHALRFDKFKSDEYDRFFNRYYDKWQVVAKEEFKKTRDHGDTFFREYGGTNVNEFFAVCVEAYFESPAEFRRLHPGIYAHMRILLNQDPLEDFNSFSANRNNYRKVHNPDFEPQGKMIYSTRFNTKNILSLLFAAGVWIFLLVSNISNGISGDQVFFGLILLVAGYYITENAFSRISFYENGIHVTSLVPPVFKRYTKFSYGEVICVEFEQHAFDETNDNIIIVYLDNGKIRKRKFIDDFSRDEILQFADFLVAKKVAVKLNALAKYSGNFTQRY
jgi:Mlc titration factor MtfA (ptsG expression regulator)